MLGGVRGGGEGPPGGDLFLRRAMYDAACPKKGGVPGIRVPLFPASKRLAREALGRVPSATLVSISAP